MTTQQWKWIGRHFPPMDTPEQMRTITLRVNGTTHTATVPVRKTLLDFVREDLMLTGSHAGCEHGVCGCCNVLLRPIQSLDLPIYRD